VRDAGKTLEEIETELRQISGSWEAVPEKEVGDGA
jgi:hypothetical protein